MDSSGGLGGGSLGGRVRGEDFGGRAVLVVAWGTWDSRRKDDGLVRSVDGDDELEGRRRDAAATE